MDDHNPAVQCSRCGTPLPPDSPEGLCLACLLAAAATSASTFTTVTSSAMAALPDPDGTPTPQLTPGQLFGPYRIVRLLGRGGMGDVYEAEHVEQGRRLAVKVLNRRFTGLEDRARFLREGQLAASINHPHSVYIFGSE